MLSGLDSRATDGETGSRNRKILDEPELSLPIFSKLSRVRLRQTILFGAKKVSFPPYFSPAGKPSSFVNLDF